MSARGEVNVALIHWPVYDRAKNIVCTNVTNFDIHDIARAGRTYGKVGVKLRQVDRDRIRRCATIDGDGAARRMSEIRKFKVRAA